MVKIPCERCTRWYLGKRPNDYTPYELAERRMTAVLYCETHHHPIEKENHDNAHDRTKHSTN